MKLYEISDKILIAMQDPESLGVTEEEWDAWQLSFTQKVEGCIQVIRNLESESLALRTEAQHFAQRAQACENRTIWLKGYIKCQMERVGKEKLDAGIFKVSVQQSPQRIEVTDDSLVPNEFIRLIREVKKSAIANYIKATGEIPEGVEIHNGTHLRIR